MNNKDCFRSKCISANGFTRPVRVINRMLPGPVNNNSKQKR